jgi:hypothetical protein
MQGLFSKWQLIFHLIIMKISDELFYLFHKILLKGEIWSFLGLINGYIDINLYYILIPWWIIFS